MCVYPRSWASFLLIFYGLSVGFLCRYCLSSLLFTFGSGLFFYPRIYLGGGKVDGGIHFITDLFSLF